VVLAHGICILFSFLLLRWFLAYSHFSEVGGLPLEEKVEEIRKGFNVEINKWIGGTSTEASMAQ